MQGYRPKGELTEAKKHEPIVRMNEALLAAGVMQQELDGVEAAARAHIEAAAAAALAAPMASTTHLKEHLYA
jgi:TPP-dependent pyruvate/acetoin dehydrogenase alpha subunit